MNISARNTFKGKIKRLVRGQVEAEVTVELPGGLEIVSVITAASVERLGLAEDQEVYAVVKASSVMISTD